MSELANRVVAIAGAAGGLGPVVARRLAAAGATLAATDIAQDRLDDLAADLGLDDDRWDGRVVDLLDGEATAAWADDLGHRFGRVDALLHLVGGWRGGDPIATAPLEDYDWLHDLLVRTVQHATRAFHDRLASSEHGRFVLVSSTQARAPGATNASYGAAKAAAEAWTLALADSFSSTRATANVIVVNAILAPGMRESAHEDPAFTPAEDVADAIVFLLSGAAAKMNGQRLELHP